MISTVIPTLNEEAEIAETIRALLTQEDEIEVIVVDGGSTDATARIAENLGVVVIRSERGRGRQMHAGALAAHGDILWFVHADTRACAVATHQMIKALRSPGISGGNFTLAFDGCTFGARLLNFVQPLMKALRCYYGDSTIFVKRDVYFELGGFQPYPLFEDADLIGRIRKTGRFLSLPGLVTTSSRRFEGRSFLATCSQWSALQLLYSIGVPAETLGRLYAPVRRAAARTE
jgi:rSAM/selenodomain-associated transferase 2